MGFGEKAGRQDIQKKEREGAGRQALREPSARTENREKGTQKYTRTRDWEEETRQCVQTENRKEGMRQSARTENRGEETRQSARTEDRGEETRQSARRENREGGTRQSVWTEDRGEETRQSVRTENRKEGMRQSARTEIREEIRRRTVRTEEIIKKYLPREEGFQKTVMEAMNYSFLAGGKRLRPMLMRETYRMFGGTSEVVEPFMAAMEMIHTYSLIHDDLPAMDDDEYRRGRKTTHIVYGEAMAILAGDGLLNLAYETACRAFSMEPGNRNVERALTILADRAGIRGMVGGQTVDVQSEGQPVSREKLDFIYRLKTGALIEASMRIGAVLAGAGEREQEIISRTAQDVGLAFQIRDDILDVAGDSAVIGKPVGSDEKNEKTTYVTILGLEGAEAEAERLSERALANLDSLGVRNPFLNDLLGTLVYREK